MYVVWLCSILWSEMGPQSDWYRNKVLPLRDELRGKQTIEHYAGVARANWGRKEWYHCARLLHDALAMMAAQPPPVVVRDAAIAQLKCASDADADMGWLAARMAALSDAKNSPGYVSEQRVRGTLNALLIELRAAQ